ncbi:MAG TPA: hypothetical protein VEG32_07645 [Clostridia bacterium]|nr:hypothetical protein [Clostridia bacterium]
MTKALKSCIAIAFAMAIAAPAEAQGSPQKPSPQVVRESDGPITSGQQSAPRLTTRANSFVALPAGTAIRLKLEEAVSTRGNSQGDTFSGRMSEAVVVDGRTVIPQGATVTGHIVRVSEPRRIAGRPSIDLRPESVIFPDGQTMPIAAFVVDTNDPETLDVDDEGRIKGPGREKMDNVELAAGTGVGAVAGAVIGGGKGTLWGALAGATVSTGHWLTKRHSMTLPAGTEIIVEISGPAPSDPLPQEGN